jgi:hypothetical protein
VPTETTLKQDFVLLQSIILMEKSTWLPLLGEGYLQLSPTIQWLERDSMNVNSSWQQQPHDEKRRPKN